jgi:catechol 2,3-dioxygenase-like lactoylglutathione lyase family enzyme
MNDMAVRYIVDNVDEAVDFYTQNLHFEVAMRPGPGFAMLRKGDLRLLLNSPGGGGGAGQDVAALTPKPGGWNRFQLQVDDLDIAVNELRSSGVEFRGDVITGRGGRQALALDPAGNVIELFEAAPQ